MLTCCTFVRWAFLSLLSDESELLGKPAIVFNIADWVEVKCDKKWLNFTFWDPEIQHLRKYFAHKELMFVLSILNTILGFS